MHRRHAFHRHVAAALMLLALGLPLLTTCGSDMDGECEGATRPRCAGLWSAGCCDYAPSPTRIHDEGRVAAGASSLAPLPPAMVALIGCPAVRELGDDEWARSESIWAAPAWPERSPVLRL